jgi:hypothetical protein
VGILITDRVNKIPLVLSFLGTYYALVTATAFAGQPAKVAELCTRAGRPRRAVAGAPPIGEPRAKKPIINIRTGTNFEVLGRPWRNNSRRPFDP